MKKKNMYSKRSKREGTRWLKYNSFNEALKMNSPFRLSENRKFFSFEGTSFNKKEVLSTYNESKGGVIVFPSDDNNIVDIEKTKIEIALNPFSNSGGYSIGNFFIGEYCDDKTDNIYSMKSFSIEIIGVSSEIFQDIVKNITKEFNLKEVLVKDYMNGETYLVDTV